MASKHREQHVIAAVACPTCGARIGELCRVLRESLAAAPGRPILHQARRDAWREWKQQGAGSQPGGVC